MDSTANAENKEIRKRYIYQAKRLSKLGKHPSTYWERSRLENMHKKLMVEATLLGIPLPKGPKLKAILNKMR